MIEPKEPIVFDHTPAWAPVGLQWVVEQREMKFRLQSIDTGEVHGRVHAEHRGRPWNIRTLSIPTPATAPEWGRTADQDPAPEFTYRVEFRGNQHAAEYHRLDQAAIALATMWDAHEEEFNELRMLNRLKRYQVAHPAVMTAPPYVLPGNWEELLGAARAVLQWRSLYTPGAMSEADWKAGDSVMLRLTEATADVTGARP